MTQMKIVLIRSKSSSSYLVLGLVGVALILQANLVLIQCFQKNQNHQAQYDDLDQDTDELQPSKLGQQQQVAGATDNYMLLNQDEVVQQSDILRYLESASKDEIEEILKDNPEIQNNLVNKISKVVADKEQQQEQLVLNPLESQQNIQVNNNNQNNFNDNYNNNYNQHDSGHQLPNRQQFQSSSSMMTTSYNTNGLGSNMMNGGQGFNYNGNGDGFVNGNIGGPIMPDKTMLMRYKLKSKANRWIKVGKGLKGKINAWKATGKSKHGLSQPPFPTCPYPPECYGPPPPTNPELLAHRDYHLHFDVLRSNGRRR